MSYIPPTLPTSRSRLSIQPDGSIVVDGAEASAVGTEHASRSVSFSAAEATEPRTKPPRPAIVRTVATATRRRRRPGRASCAAASTRAAPGGARRSSRRAMAGCGSGGRRRTGRRRASGWRSSTRRATRGGGWRAASTSATSPSAARRATSSPQLYRSLVRVFGNPVLDPQKEEFKAAPPYTVIEHVAKVRGTLVSSGELRVLAAEVRADHDGRHAYSVKRTDRSRLSRSRRRRPPRGARPPRPRRRPSPCSAAPASSAAT